MKQEESVFAGKKKLVNYSINEDLVELIDGMGDAIGLSSSDIVNGLLTLYFEERGFYKRHSFHETKYS